jgi:hypothetical protein
MHPDARHRHSPEVREAVLSDLRAGGSQYGVARTHGVPVRTVSYWASRAGITPAEAALARAENARQALLDYTRVERIRVGNRLYTALEAMLPEDLEELPKITSAGDLQRLGVLHGILSDKRHLEDGESAGPVIHVNVGFLAGGQSPAEPSVEPRGDVVEGAD